MKSNTTSFYRYFPVSKRDKNWGLYATTVGESRIAPNAAYPPGGHPKGFAFEWQRGRVLDNFALVYISSGSGRFESKPNISAAIEPGHAFLLFPGVWHRYAPDMQTGWHEHWIGFDGETARRWQKHKFISHKNPILKINAEDTVLATFSRMMQSARASRPALQQILAGATANLLGLFYSAQQAQFWSGYDMAAHAREQLGLDVTEGTLEDLPREQPYDVISMIQVVAHFPDIQRALAAAARATAPHGWWLIETWDCGSLTARAFGGSWHEYSPPSVLHWFTRRSLQLLAAQHGFDQVATGRPKKFLNAGHAKSLLRHALGGLGRSRLFDLTSRLLPDRVQLPYPAEDLFWSLFRRRPD